MNGNVVLVVCCVVGGVIVLCSALLVFVVGVVEVDVIDGVVDLILVVAGSEVVIESVLSVVGAVVDGQ